MTTKLCKSLKMESLYYDSIVWCGVNPLRHIPVLILQVLLLGEVLLNCTYSMAWLAGETIAEASWPSFHPTHQTQLMTFTPGA